VVTELWSACRADMPTAIMDLLVFYPETTEPKRRHFDGPVLLGVQQALGENAEVIPGFTTIPCDGVIQRCIAYCDRHAKRNGLPINTWATTLWHMCSNVKATNVAYVVRTVR
jgi:hypothetical protein